MKPSKLLSAFFLAGISILLTCCEKEEGAELTLSLSEWEFESAGGRITADIFSPGNWRISGVPDWCTVDPVEGTGNATVEIAAAANDEAEARNITLLVTATNTSRELILRQPMKEATTLSVSTSILHFINQRCGRKLDIATDGVWIVSGLPDWCTVDQEKGVGKATLTIQAAANETDRQREAEFTVTAGKVSERVIVRQTYPGALIDGTTLEVLTPGSLMDFLPYAEELEGTTHLTITGRMNARDIGQIDIYDCLSEVTSVDMRAVRIEKSKFASEAYVYEDNEFTGFAGFKRLTSVILPESLTKIGYFAFQHCTGLTTLTIPRKVAVVEIMAFDGCRNLESVYFSDSLNYLGEAVFFDCEKLSAIHLASPTPPGLHADALSYFPISTCTLYVPKGSKTAYEAKGWNKFKEITEE